LCSLAVSSAFQKYTDAFVTHKTLGISCAKPISIGGDGWVRNDKGELVLWIPHHARKSLLDQSAMHIGPYGVEEENDKSGLDLSNFCYGENWIEVYTPVEEEPCPLLDF
jgi:hypothetical protein